MDSQMSWPTFLAHPVGLSLFHTEYLCLFTIGYIFPEVNIVVVAYIGLQYRSADYELRRQIWEERIRNRKTQEKLNRL